MAHLNETNKGEQYINGEWIVEVIDVKPPKVLTKVLKPAYKAGKTKDFFASDWTAFQRYPQGESSKEDGSKHHQEKQSQGQHYNIEIDETGNLVIRDSKGLEIIATNIKGPQGNKGDIGPQGPRGVNGADGMSIEPRITDDGERIYFVDGTGKIISNEFQLRGKPGTDGKTYTPKVSEDGRALYFVNEKGEKVSNDILIKGEDGKQGPAGPAGQDGKLWKPEISTDRTQLRFVNGLDSTDTTPWYDIQGAKGDTGGEGPQGVPGPAGPVFIPSVNPDGELSWSNTGQGLTNPVTRNIKGDKGDKGDKGATFHPIVKDGVLYWYDDKGDLVKEITPVKITGAQGKQGEPGSQGLSAYQIWLKQGYRGTEQDFLDSLKGEKGVPAPPASFSFKDVEDFTCDIQKIDTKLIVDKDDDTDSPEQIIEKRTEEIKQLRREGHKTENKRNFRVGFFKKFTWWCAGVDQDLLTMCPGDHSKYAGVGTVILFTALMAWFSSFIAMRLVLNVADEGIMNLGTLGAAIFATFWAAMIFCLDRFITNTMYSDGKVTISKQEFICGLPRIIIAIFLGIVISAPLELMIFKDEINNKISNELKINNRQHIEDKKNQEIASLNHVIDSLVGEKVNIVANQAKIPQLLKNIEDENKKRDAAVSKEKKDIVSVSIRRQNGESDEAYNERKSAETSKANNKASEDLQTRIKNAAAPYDHKIDSLKSLIVQYSADTTQYNSIIASKNNELLKTDSDYSRKIFEADSVFMLRLGLKTQLEALHRIAMEGYVPFNDKKNTWYDYITLHPLLYYLFFSSIGLIMFLFILIDISPVLYKMMLADGNYDNYLHQEKLLAQDKMRLSLSNMLKKLDDSELKRVAPFIMGDIYEKMAGDSYIYKTEDDFKAEIAAQKNVCWFWRIWPLSMIRWIFWKEEGKPTAPVIVLSSKDPTENQKAVINANKEVFEEVLDMKKKIILASYRRWYKTQHDCIICDDVNDENKAREPFDDEAPEGDDSEIHMEVGDEDYATFDTDTAPEDDDLDKEPFKTDNTGSENPKSNEDTNNSDDDKQESLGDDSDDHARKQY